MLYNRVKQSQRGCGKDWSHNMAKNEEAAAEAAATKEKEPKIAPKPEGFESPYQFAKALSEHVGREIRPQTVYAMVRNQPKLKDGTPFPVEQNTDGHYMVNVEAGLGWYDARQEERAAAKVEKAAAKAAKAESDEAVAE